MLIWVLLARHQLLQPSIDHKYSPTIDFCHKYLPLGKASTLVVHTVVGGHMARATLETDVAESQPTLGSHELLESVDMPSDFTWCNKDGKLLGGRMWQVASQPPGRP